MTSYWGGRKSEAFYWACRVVNLSLTRGPTSATGNACMTAALGYGHVFKKYNFAEVAISLRNIQDISI